MEGPWNQAVRVVTDPEPGRAYVRGEPESWTKGCQELKVVPEEARVAKHPAGRVRVLHIQGPCPACGHILSREISPLAKGALFAPSKQTEGPRRYFVTCNCVSPHSGAPDGVRGCGAQGGVEVTTTATGWEVGYASLSIEERDADEWAERARLEQLTRVRQLASHWTDVWGVIAGLVAVGMIVDAEKADGKIYGLDPPTSTIYVALVGLALAAAVLAVLFAARAAGLRELDDIPADVKGRVGLQVAMVAYCRSRLTLSKFLALCSVALVALALGLRLFG